MKKTKKQKEPYLKIPAHILNLSGIGLCEKVLLAHIYSFGAKGCWQSNKTLAEIFMVSAVTIRRWLARIRPYTYVRNPKGYYRTIWSKSALKNEQGPAQNCAIDLVKSAHRPAQKCATTNNNTITENNNKTIASPSPLPASGQASATLEARRQQAAAAIENFRANFGRLPKIKPLTPQQFEQRRAQQLAALRTAERRRHGDG